VIHIEDGEIWYAGTAPGVWGITWFPNRSDHPDAPELVTDRGRKESRSLAAMTRLPTA